MTRTPVSCDLRRFMLEGGHRGKIAMIKSKHKEQNKRNGNRLAEDKRRPGEGLRGGGEGADGVRHRSMATAQSGARSGRGAEPTAPA